jgi:peptidoglycan/LPS O-acetylase OafA/YrhL
MQPHGRFFTTLDGIRGVAAIMVVAFHSAPLFGKGIVNEQFLAVDLFFVLSGVVLANAYEHRFRSGLSVSGFVRIRLIRLYPLYMFGTAIRLIAIGGGLILSGSSSAGDGHQLAAALILAILMLPNPFVDLAFPLNPPAWSLFVELLGNTTYASVFRLLKPYVLGAIMAVSALALAGFLYFRPQHDFDIGGTAEQLTGGFFRLGYSFFAGVLLYRLFASQNVTLKDDRRMAFMPWVILGLVAVMLGAKPQASVRPYYELAVTTLFFPAIIYCALWFEPTGVGGRVCKFLGAVSYAVYAIHMPLYWLISATAKKVLHVPEESLAPWTGFFLLGLLLALCWALDKFYDRPLRSFLLARGQFKITVPDKA